MLKRHPKVCMSRPWASAVEHRPDPGLRKPAEPKRSLQASKSINRSVTFSKEEVAEEAPRLSRSMSRLSKLDSIIRDNSYLIEKIVLKRSKLNAQQRSSQSPKEKPPRESPVGFLAVSCDLADSKENSRFGANSSSRCTQTPNPKPGPAAASKQLNKWTARASESGRRKQPAAGVHLGLRERRDLAKISKQLN